MRKKLSGLFATLCCATSVKVSSGSKSFSASGKTSEDGNKYIYIYKGMDDGYDVSISGTISY